MGVELHLTIVPSRISAEEWSTFYRETLTLLGQFPFLMTESDGDGHLYARRSAHQENILDGYAGWCVEGDMRTGPNMENFYLLEDLEYYRRQTRGAADNGHDILISSLYREVSLEAPPRVYVWGGKTQGQPAHSYLLAIGCLICHRLQDAAYIFGDITADQCRKAVQWANQFLDEPIDVPVTANQSRLLKRLRIVGIEGESLLASFLRLTLETRSEELGSCLKQEFSVDVISGYYKKKLQPCRRDPERLYLDKRALKEYLQMGLDFPALCRIVMMEQNGNQLTAREFMKVLLEMKLHIPVEEKVIYELACLPQDGVDSVDRQLHWVWSVMHGAGNRNVAAYRSLEEIRTDFTVVLGVADYRTMAEELLAEIGKSVANEDQDILYDGPDSLYKMMAQKQMEEGQLGGYDIAEQEDVIDFRCGDLVAPKLHDMLLDCMKQIRRIGEKAFREYVKSLNEERRRAWFLLNYRLLIPKDVETAFFARIMEEDYIVRYVGLYAVEATEGVRWAIRAFLWNRELLDYYWSLAEESEDGR